MSTESNLTSETKTETQLRVRLGKMRHALDRIRMRDAERGQYREAFETCKLIAQDTVESDERYASKRGKGHVTECPERDANARLIAAAPALLEAAKAALPMLLDTHDVAVQIRAALALAEGKPADLQPHE